MTAERGAAWPWRRDGAAVTLSARLTPRADRDAVDGVSHFADGRCVLLARVRAVPEDGKANDAARKLLAEAAEAPVSRVDLGSGAGARLKLFRMAGDAGAIVSALERTLSREKKSAR